MDQRTWLWRRKSSEKTVLANSEEVCVTFSTVKLKVCSI